MSTESNIKNPAGTIELGAFSDESSKLFVTDGDAISEVSTFIHDSRSTAKITKFGPSMWFVQARHPDVDARDAMYDALSL